MSKPISALRRLRRRASTTVAITSTLATAALALTACGGQSDAGGSKSGAYRIAITQDLTGPLAQSGTAIGAGVEAYIKKVNQGGGVNDHKVNLSVTDTLSTDAGSIAATQKAIGSNPVAVILGGAATSSVMPLVKQTKTVAFFSTAGTDTDLYPKPVPNFFVTMASTEQQATALVRQAAAVLGGSLQGKKLGYFAMSHPYMDSLLAALKQKAQEAGGSFTAEERYPIGAVSYSSQAAKMAASGVDAVIFAGTTGGSPAGVKALVDAGVDVPILGYSASSSDAVLKGAASPNVMGLRVSVVPDAGTEIAKAAAAVGFGGKAVEWTFSLGWQQAAIIVEGLRRCGDGCSSQKLISAVEGIKSFEVPSGAIYGPVSFSPEKHASMTTAQFVKYDGGGIVDAGKPVDMGS